MKTANHPPFSKSVKTNVVKWFLAKVFQVNIRKMFNRNRKLYIAVFFYLVWQYLSQHTTIKFSTKKKNLPLKKNTSLLNGTVLDKSIIYMKWSEKWPMFSLLCKDNTLMYDVTLCRWFSMRYLLIEIKIHSFIHSFIHMTLSNKKILLNNLNNY